VYKRQDLHTGPASQAGALQRWAEGLALRYADWKRRRITSR
jgi:hypothetical protein